MKFKYTDGGRKAAGFKSLKGDCAVRAIAIATGSDYATTHKELSDLKREYLYNKLKRTRDIKKFAMYEKEYYKGESVSVENGTPKDVTRKYLTSRGWKWVATMKIGSGCRVHLRESELPSGIIICSVSRHLVCVIDGVIHDNHDCSRDESRCVYGYFTKEEK